MLQFFIEMLYAINTDMTQFFYSMTSFAYWSELENTNQLYLDMYICLLEYSVMPIW